MAFRFFNLTIFFMTIIFSLKVYANQLELDLKSVKSIKHQYNCFSAEFSSYDSWLDFVRTKKEAQFERQGVENSAKKLENFAANFEKMFPRADFNSAKDNLECRFLTYIVGNQEIHGVLIVPKKGLTRDEKTPVIIYNRGGTRGYGNLVFGHVAHELFPIAQEGFAIIASNYRDNEQYGADNIDEVTALFGVIEKISGLKSDKVGVYGISRGGLTSWQLAKEVPNKIAAIATVNGVTDVTSWADDRDGIRKNVSLIDGYNEDPEKILTRLSPIRWVDKISKAPILLIHSRDDEKVSIMQSISFSEQLIKNERIFKMNIFENGGHSLTGHKEEAKEEIVKWFSYYIK